jgi:peptidoglycan hydrolase CwlO-like protein
MKIDKTNILLLIIAVLAVFNIFTLKRIQTDVAGYNKKIDMIQKEIDSVSQANKEITTQITSLDKDIWSIDGSIDSVTNKISRIKTNTNDKTNNVNFLTVPELTKFFSDRYDSASKVTGGKNGH